MAEFTMNDHRLDPYKNFKFKVKLTPGTAKKGRTSKQAVELFGCQRDCTATERTLMKGLSDPEMVAIMIGDVKLSVPGLTQHLMQQKKKNKSAAKKK